MVDSFSSHSTLENVRFCMNRKHVKEMKEGDNK